MGTAIALEVSGPARPWTFCARLPLAVLAISVGLMLARRWRRRWLERRSPGQEGPGRIGFLSRAKPVPMATPCLVLTATAGLTAETIRLLTAFPALTGALAAASAGLLCLSLGLYLCRSGMLAVSPDLPRGARGGRSPGR